MKVNDKELANCGLGMSVIEGRLYYKRLGGNLPQAGFRERLFKLRANILFYFNVAEGGKVLDEKPAGALVLEHCTTAYEAPCVTPFSFSITFNDEIDKKHLFSGRTEANIANWVNALKAASYEFWRSNLLMLQIKLNSITGQDSVLMYHLNAGSKLPIASVAERQSNGKKKHASSQNSFKSYVDATRTTTPPISDLHFDESHFGNGLDAIGSAPTNERATTSTVTTDAIEALKEGGIHKATFYRPKPNTIESSVTTTSIAPRLRPAPPPPRPPRASKVSQPASTTNLIDL